MFLSSPIRTKHSASCFEASCLSLFTLYVQIQSISIKKGRCLNIRLFLYSSDFPAISLIFSGTFLLPRYVSSVPHLSLLSWQRALFVAETASPRKTGHKQSGCIHTVEQPWGPTGRCRNKRQAIKPAIAFPSFSDIYSKEYTIPSSKYTEHSGKNTPE